MAAPERLVILVHEKDTRAASRPYRLWDLCARWRERGMEVVIQRGVPNAPTDDIVVNHVDITVLGPPYRDYLARCPRTINGRVLDIRKRTFSRQLVGPDDAYDGPVIVKTDLNNGGRRERKWSARRSWLGRRPRLHTKLPRARFLDPNAYPGFERAGELPRAVHDNPALVVERLLVEREGPHYVLRNYYFLGSASYCVRRVGPGPLFKGRNTVSTEVTPVPDALAAERERLGFDYGKFDFLMCDGEPRLLDANKTVGYDDWPGSLDMRRNVTEALEAGIDDWL